MFNFSARKADDGSASVELRVNALLERMTLAEKIGQMCQVNASEGYPPHYLTEGLQHGRIGSVINNVDVNVLNELQGIAVHQSRLGIPLLVGRDVIHGFKTVMPIPLGQAATWNPELVKQAASAAAAEAAACGVNWTFAPMMDVARDARWGRIAESFGEDPYLSSVMAVAMVQGFQGESLADPTSIAACAKHFAGYGESESGRDYATTNIPENELRNVHLRPFKAAVDAGVATLMTSFSDLNGVPATANTFLLRQILRDEWQFDGFVVSDWDSVRQLSIHGLTENDEQSALQALVAGVDMEMAGDAYNHHLEGLLADGHIDIALIDDAVRRILAIKFRLGLFEHPFTDASAHSSAGSDQSLAIARQSALESVVLLKNDSDTLPLSADTLTNIAVIGPLAHAPYEQLGTWIFDGDASISVTPKQAIETLLGDRVTVTHVAAMDNSRSRAGPQFFDAVDAALAADAVVLFLGEESILSGEAHSRADINLPGDQAELVRRIREAGKPVVAVVLAGRPLTLTNIVDEVDALMFAWHPGTMSGPAIADLLFGVESPSGKLPATFPRMVGQIPIYYNQKHGGKPPLPHTIVHIDEIDAEAPQTSFGMSAFHLDAGAQPLYPFGFGLSYTQFEYSDIAVSSAEIVNGAPITITARLTNTGDRAASEVAQLYIRDLVGSVTRPVLELKGFQRVALAPGESADLSFTLSADDLGFFGRDMRFATEPGQFHAWVGGSSQASLRTEFRIVDGH